MLKDIDFDLKSLEKDVKIAAREIYNYRVGSKDPVPLLYQSGYLTIKGYDKKYNKFVLGFPNEEVKYGFMYELCPIYLPETDVFHEFFIGDFVEDLRTGKVESFMTRLQAFFASISYKLKNKDEKDFQTAFFILFKLMGQFVEVEQCSAKGSADAVVKTFKYVYVFEFKVTGRGTAEKAIQQIENKGYVIPFKAGKRKIIKIGVEFSLKERGVKDWKIKN
jgi:hypothetical protein